MRLAFSGLMAALSEGASVVTPNALLSSVALEQYNRAQIARGLSSWERPRIAHRAEWMASCWQESRASLTPVPLLLSPAQERELWRQIIEADCPDLFNVNAMAGMAQRASAIMAEYHIPASGEAWQQNPDAAAFLRWRQTMQKRLKDEHWTSRAGLWTLLPAWIENSAVTTGRVLFAPFSEVSPGVLRMQQSAAGLTIGTAAPMAATRFESVEQELEHAARAARWLIESEGVTSVGVLVCDLASRASEVRRAFGEVFYPSGVEGDHFHLQSQPLLLQPLITNALLLLELAKTRIGHASAAAILRCPFVEGAARERSARALAAAKLGRLRELDFSRQEICYAASSCPGLTAILRRVEKELAKAASRMPLASWSGLFSGMLQAAKWPSIDDPTEAERHAIQAWADGLSELASLGLVSPDVTLEGALERLRLLLQRLASQGHWSSPVQILDAASAEGVEFDCALIVNAAKEGWPPPAGLTALIPYAVQRAHRVPGSHAETLAEERWRRTRALAASAPRVYLSFTGALAPMFRPYADFTLPACPVWSEVTAGQAYPPVALASLEDNAAPALEASDTFRGGASVIKSQSQCPFRAFAEYRLLAKREDEACFGFNALERGTFVHKALELIWMRLRNQAALNLLSPAELEALIEESIDGALSQQVDGPVHELTSHIERQRLRGVLADWLAVERARPIPFTVELMEEKRQIELAGLKLEIRVDRMDRLPDGSVVLLDYKTGMTSQKKLEGDRPPEPQLLVYAAAMGERVEGLYFGEVRNRETRAVGHAGRKHFASKAIKEHRTGWSEFLRQAGETVDNLAGHFKAGDAIVDPTKTACDYCQVKPLCRIRSNSSGQEEEE